MYVLICMVVFVFVGMCVCVCGVMNHKVWKMVSDLFSEDQKG